MKLREKVVNKTSTLDTNQVNKNHRTFPLILGGGGLKANSAQCSLGWGWAWQYWAAWKTLFPFNGPENLSFFWRSTGYNCHSDTSLGSFYPMWLKCLYRQDKFPTNLDAKFVVTKNIAK